VLVLILKLVFLSKFLKKYIMKFISNYPSRNEPIIILINIICICFTIGMIIQGDFRVFLLLSILYPYSMFTTYMMYDVVYNEYDKRFEVRRQFRQKEYYHVAVFVKIKKVFGGYYTILFNDSSKYYFQLNFKDTFKDHFSLDVDFKIDREMTKEFLAIAKQHEEENK